MTCDVMNTVLQCRCSVDGVAYDIEVSVHESHERVDYHAVAFVASGQAAARKPVTNERGMPLVAVGKSPSTAASYLAAALRRRYRRRDGREAVAAQPDRVRDAVEVGSE